MKKISNKWYQIEDLYYDDDHEFIDFNYYRKLSFEEVSEKLFNYNDSVSIMRRNFRDNDIITNNTKLGRVYKRYWSSSWEQKEIDLKGGKNYTDFPSDRQDKASVSKNVITNNGKRLISVLNSIRGYAIKNYKELKNRYKSNKFTKKDISIYQNLDYYYLTNINGMYNLQYNLSIILTECQIKLSKNYETSKKMSIIIDIDDILSLLSKINTKQDMYILKSYTTNSSIPIEWVNDSIGFYKNLESILLENREKLKKLIEFDKEIIKGKKITNEENYELTQSKSQYKINNNYNLLKEDIEKIINKYYGEYDIQIKVPKFFLMYKNILDDIIIEIKNPPL